MRSIVQKLWNYYPEGRWRAFDNGELINCDKASLDIFWLKDESLEDSENLPAPRFSLRRSRKTWKLHWSSFGRLLPIWANRETLSSYGGHDGRTRVHLGLAPPGCLEFTQIPNF